MGNVCYWYLYWGLTSRVLCIVKDAKHLCVSAMTACMHVMLIPSACSPFDWYATFTKDIVCVCVRVH